MKNYKRILICFAGLSFAGLAHATTISATVTGVITYSSDDYGNAFGLGAGVGTFVGKTVVQQFTYDTNTAVVNLNTSDPKGANYAPPFSPSTLSGSWITVKTTIDGITLPEPAETPGPNAYANIDSLTLYNGYDIATNNTFKDIVQIDQGGQNVVHNLTSDVYTTSQSSVHIEKFGNIINDLSLNQQFSLDTYQSYFSGGGQVSRGIVEVTPGGSNIIANGYFNYVAHTVMFEAITPVPVPSSLILMLSGFTPMVAAFYRNRRCLR